MLWLAASDFGDDGTHYRNQVRKSLPQLWGLGIEGVAQPEFWSLYRRWVEKNG